MQIEGLSKVQSDLVHQAAQQNNFQNYEVTINSGSNKGDNYLGIITQVLIKEASGKTLDLILKTSHSSEKLRESTPIRTVYQREIKVYSEIFPIFDQLCRDAGLEPIHIHAKYYGSSSKNGEECILLENMKAKGYELKDRMKTMDSNHIEKVFESYGKFHALSRVFRKLQPEKYEEIRKTLTPVFDEVNKDPEQRILKAKKRLSTFQNLFEPGSKYVEGLKRVVEGRFFETLQESRLKHPEKNIISHGDCWCNNILFNYENQEEPQKPSTVCFIDWQICSDTLATEDLSYFFFVCSAKKEMDRYKHYLKIYYDSVINTMDKFGLESKTIYPYSDLEEEWKKCAIFGFYVGSLLIKIMLSESKETVDIEKNAEQDIDFIQSLTDQVCSHQDLVDQRLRDIIIFMVDNNLM